MDEKNMNKTISYISDWHKRTSKKQRKYNIMLTLAVVIAMAVCIVLFILFQQSNHNRIIDINMKYIQDSSLQEANQIEQKLDNAIKQIRSYSFQYSTLIMQNDDSSIEDKLRILNNEAIFDRIAFIAPDGTDTSLEGVCNVSDREYFRKAMTGESGYEFIFASKITNESTLVFYAPIYIEDNIAGVMAGFYERERIDNIFAYRLFNFTPDTYLIEANGVVVANSEDKYITENMLDKMSNKEYSGTNDYDDILSAINDKERTSITFTFKEHGNTSIGVISQFSSSEWFVLSILPHEITNEMIKNANRTGGIFTIAIIAVFIIVSIIILYVMFVRYRQLEKEMSLSTENLRETFIHDQKQAFVIDSLSNTYSSVYYIDIESNRYERIAESEESSKAFPDNSAWYTTYTKYVENFVNTEYRKDMFKFRDVDKFEKYLSGNENISLEYQRIDNCWRKAFMIPADRDEKGRIKSVIFAVQKIDAEKKKELETQKALREAYEGAQLASHAKTTFLSNMSHDIRTPMNAIVGMTAIASANITNTEKVADCLKNITNASKHLLGLINEVLDMSKIESGKVDLSEVDFNLSDLIDELILINQPLIKEKNHTLAVKINNVTHEKVIGDKTRLQQVFTNILTNAVKYTNAGGRIDITISEKVTNKSNIGWYEVIFKDNGIGMSEEYQKNIFDPFTRADDNRISTIQGTGLGMPIARNIVRMMNGDIKVESEINKGSTFIVSFALKLQSEIEIDYTKFVNLPVLVVDDDVTACESTCLILDSMSMQSEYVTSGKQAVQKTIEHHDNNDDYYAVIVDWKMPEMNGIETTREIRKHIGNEIPVIVLTAYDWADIEKEAKEAGVSAFLSKPLFKSRLVNVFSGLLNSSDSIIHEETDDIKDVDFSGKRILLAEDNEINMEIAVEILSMMNLEVDTAENGKVCLEKFLSAERNYYDLILMDIQMPLMNGYETTRAIRSCAYSNYQNIPIIAMTANAFSTDVQDAFNSGMNGHISKPIDIDNVVRTLRNHLR